MSDVLLPILQRGAVVPPFALPSHTGDVISRSSYHGRKHLALLFLSVSEDTSAYLQNLAARAPEIEAASGAVLVIVRAASLAELQIKTASWTFLFPVLYDTNGITLARFLPHCSENGMFIIDRYGELYYQSLGTQVHHLPTASTIVDWLEAIDNQRSV